MESFHIIRAKGKIWKYTNVTFKPSVEIIKSLSKTSKSIAPSKAKKPQMDRKVNDLKFCLVAGCAESFFDEVSLQEHLIAGSHTNETAPKPMMDKARWLSHWIPNPGVPYSKPLGGSKVDSAFHPSKVHKISTRNFWELSGKK